MSPTATVPKTAPPPELEHVVEQFRTELVRMYLAGEIGKIECDCGDDRWVVKSMPIRRNEPVKVTPRHSVIVR